MLWSPSLMRHGSLNATPAERVGGRWDLSTFSVHYSPSGKCNCSDNKHRAAAGHMEPFGRSNVYPQPSRHESFDG